MNVFIGELPPPYGGVAVKDKLVYKEIYESLGVKMLDLVECKRKPYKIPLIGIKMLFYLVKAKHVIIGVGTNRRRIILMKLRKILRGTKGLNTTILLAMGGQIHNSVKEDIKFKNLLLFNQSVWVETEEMKKELEKQGFNNVRFFPNCRSDEGACAPGKVGEKIKYVFFSRICSEKGVDEIIEAINKNNGVWTVDFYGEIADDYKDKFNLLLKTHPEVKYHGVYDSTNGNVYCELNQYDAILLPTKWKGEGVPGALVESKMAGIAAIVSDWNFNSEVVIDGVEGVLLNDDLCNILNEMNREKIMELKQGAFESRKRYSIKTYKNELAKDIFES